MVVAFEKTCIILFALCPTFHSYQAVFIFFGLHRNYKVYYKDITKISQLSI